ncbi:MAG: hypothetical protein SGBAC_005235 [Bacillariaceae sp.]
MNGASKPQFKAVLSARANDGRPSDLEFLLRSQCQKIKVVKKLSGAHLMIKQDKTSLAVRAYFSHNLQEMKDNENENNQKRKSHEEEKYDYDDLSCFLKGFKVSIIFFILPMEEQRNQLDDPLSFLQRAQKLVQQLAQNEMGKIAQVYLLSNAAKAVDLLHSVAKTLDPSTEAKKHKYFARKHKQLFLPQPTCIPATTHADGAKHVREAIAAWADRFEFPPTEADVLCNMMNNLQTVASADNKVLQGIPLDPRTKQCMMQFFGTGPLLEVEESQSQSIQSQQIHLDAVDPPSPLTIPDMRQQQQMQMQRQHHQQKQQELTFVPHHQPQYQQQPSHRPNSTRLNPNENMMMMMQSQQSQMHGLARFGANSNPNPNPSRTVVQTNSFAAQYSNTQGGLSMQSESQSQSQPAPHGGHHHGPPTRTIYQETIMTAAAMPTPHPNGYHLQQIPHDMQFHMQNTPGQHYHHHHQHDQQQQQQQQQGRSSYSTNRHHHHPHAFQESTPHHQGPLYQGHPSSLPYHPSQQESVANQQPNSYAMPASSSSSSIRPMIMNTTSTPVKNARMPYYNRNNNHQKQQQQQSKNITTPMMMMPTRRPQQQQQQQQQHQMQPQRMMSSSRRNNPLHSSSAKFPPRRQRRFVP